MNTDRFGKGLLVVLGIATVAIVVAAYLATGGSRRVATGENALGNPPGMSDRLELMEAREIFERGSKDHVAVRVGAPAALVLDGGSESYPRTGRWTSAETPSEFRFTELLPSWNVAAPAETGLRMEVRVRRAGTQKWTPWLDIGAWGKTPAERERVTACREGVVDVDYLALDVPADAYQVRVSLFGFTMDSAVTPVVRRVAVCYSGVTGEKHVEGPVEGWVRDLAVPFRTQKDAPKSLSGEICSPTSVTMVMAYCGVDRPVVENALAIWDNEHGMFGNWGRAVARASELGLDGWLTRFRSWDQVKQQIAAGQPVIASIRFKKGAFPSAVLPSTSGHLIVIRGFTASGDVIVNDPASREKGNGVVYRAEELGRAWFDHGGVGYVITRPRVATTRPAEGVVRR
jgi:hypothetical protein